VHCYLGSARSGSKKVAAGTKTTGRSCGTVDGAIRETEAEEIDAFLVEEKRIDGLPLWQSSAFPGEMNAVWNIEDT
jgi:hypothetical protein